MPASEIEICNLALLRVGITTPLATLADGTKESNACNTLYSQMRDLLLGSFPWSFATRRDAPAASSESVRTGWQHIYDLPDDVLSVQKIWSGARRVRPEQEIPFKVEVKADGSGRVLLTDKEEPEVFTTIRLTNVLLFSPFFSDALASLLAVELVPALTLAEAMSARAMQRFQFSFANALTADADQHREDPPPRDTFTASRHGGLALVPYDVPVVSEGT